MFISESCMLFKSSFKRLIFALLEQINVCSQSQPRLSFRHVRYSTTKFPSIHEVNGQLFHCFLLASWQIRRLSYQAPVLREVFSLMRVSRRIYTGGIPEEISVYIEIGLLCNQQYLELSLTINRNKIHTMCKFVVSLLSQFTNSHSHA